MKQEKKWLKKDDKLNVKGKLLYSCKKLKKHGKPDSQPETPVDSPDSSEVSKQPQISVASSSSDRIEPLKKKKKLFHESKIDLSPFFTGETLPLVEKLTELDVNIIQYSNDVGTCRGMPKKLSNIRSMVEKLTTVKKELLLSIIDLFSNFLIGVLNSSQKNESTISNFIAVEESQKDEIEKQKLLSRNKQGWTLQAVASRQEIFFWSGFHSAEQFQEKILPSLLTSPQHRT